MHALYVTARISRSHISFCEFIISILLAELNGLDEHMGITG